MNRLPKPRRTVGQPLVTVSASFNRYLRETQLVVEELFDEGARVLSPVLPTAYKEINGGFLLLDGDRPYVDLSIRGVQDRHLACIAQSDFLWVVCPGGYIGNSTGMEIGAAISCGVPIYSLDLPNCSRIAAYITIVTEVKIAVLNHKLATI